MYGTGNHAAHRARVRPGDLVAVIGDGAVGLLAVLSARRPGAERIILMGRHKGRTDLGRFFGATHVVAARGEEGIAEVRDLTGGHGTRAVLEAVGHLPAYEMALGAVRPGGVISRVGVPQYDDAPSASAASSDRTSPSPAAPPPSAPTSTSCFPRSWTAPPNPAVSSTAPSPWSRRPRATAPWTGVKHSRFS